MEHNEITLTVDVKMDLKERRSEFHQFRNWTRTTLRIEAIKCFPCYVKVTFIHMSPPHMPTVNNVVNINLPGLTVNLATSRTKPHTYGLFWKNNRNRCCIYLAFDNAEQCGRHHHWMQTSIRNLDLHRREILETRRASRFERFAGHGQQHTSVDGVGGQSIASSITGGTGRFNETAGYIPDLNDILGPLPAVPDSAAHWSRRISGVSGIYEEILERSYADSLASVLVSPPAAGSGSSARERRKLSRVSVASGIYEVMRPPMQSIRETVPPSPPPLPPRSRTFTNQEIEFKRSYTNPDAETFKNRGGVHGILHQLHLKQQGIATNPLHSYSSPDLTKLSPVPKTPQTPTPTNCCITSTTPNTVNTNTHTVVSRDLLTLTQSMQNLCSPSVSTPGSYTSRMGTPLHEYIEQLPHTTPNTPSHMPSKVIECASGYCAMAPIIIDPPVLESLYMSLNSSKLLVAAGLDCVDGSPSAKSSSNRQSGSDTENQHISTPNNGCSKRKQPTESDAIKSPLRSTSTNHHNVAVPSRTDSDHLCFTPSPPVHRKHSSAHIKLCATEPRRPLSIDEKYPSYYPNVNFAQRHPSHHHHHHTSTPSAQKSSKRTQRARSQEPAAADAANSDRRNHISVATTTHTSNTMTTISNGGEETGKRVRLKHKLLRGGRPKCDGPDVNHVAIKPNAKPFDDIIDENIAQNEAGAVTRVSSTVEKSSSKVATSIKRFASLPRFRKLNFSPLKLKINSVLQR